MSTGPRICSTPADTFVIFDAPRLDPVTVVLIDLGTGCGHLIISCYSEAWSCYWGAMGDKKLAQFIDSCSSGYVANKLWNQHVRRSKEKEGYLGRIVDAVKAAIASRILTP